MFNYNNIGGKIQGLAKFFFILGAIFSVIGGISTIAAFDGEALGFLTAIVVIIVGAIGSWIGSWMLYGFGELIVKTTEIAENTRH